MDKLKSSEELITEFDKQMWYALIEKVVINHEGALEFEFKNGQKLTFY